jgi:hypothetical protein
VRERMLNEENNEESAGCQEENEDERRDPSELRAQAS